MTSYRIHLTQTEVSALLDYDPDTGIMRWRHRADRSRRWNSRYSGTIAGQISNGYVAIQVAGKGAYQGARLAWLIIYGQWPTNQIDHINGIRDDNRISNLREVDNSQNNMNRGAQSNNLAGIRGLAKHPTAGWRVRIQARGESHDLGYFKDRDEAIAARKALETKLHGEYARREVI